MPKLGWPAGSDPRSSAPEGGRGGGSNVALRSPEAVDAEISRRNELVDQALAAWRDAIDAHEAAEALRAENYHELLQGELAGGAKITEARLRASGRNAKFEASASRAAGIREYCKALVGARKAQLSAEQSRAKLLQEQMSYDRTGPR